MKVSRPEKLLFRFLFLGDFMFLIISDVCTWAVFSFLLVQVSVLASFSVPHLSRCLCLGGFFSLTGTGVCAWRIFVLHLCMFLYLGGFLFFTGATVGSLEFFCSLFVQVSVP